MATERLSRKEQQARTRADLLEAAGRIFAARGMNGASLDAVAHEAGYTKGAVYANFASKEDLFIALLEQRFADRQAAFDEQLANTEVSLQAQAVASGAEFTAYLDRDRDWERLFFEFAAHAGRDPEFRARLVGQYDGLIDRITDAVARYTEATGIAAPRADIHRLALLIFAGANGLALQRMLDPGKVPDDLMGEMFELLALGAMAKLALPRQGSPAPSPASMGQRAGGLPDG